MLSLVNGFAFKPTQWQKHGLPIIRIQNLNNPRAPYNFCAEKLPEKVRVKRGDLLFAWSGTPGTSFGAHIWAGDDAWLNQHIFRVEFDSRLFDRSFLKHAVNQNLSEYISKAHGGAGLAHITKSVFEASMLRMPPFNEQRRIVAKLEKLLAKVDACKERLDKIPTLLKRFRQSVLAAACSGRLTADWRRRNEVPDAWDLTMIKSVCEIIGGSQPPKKYFIYEPKEGYIRFIQIRDYKSDQHVTFIPQILARRLCSKQDVMIGRYGPPLFQILRGIEGAYNVALMKAVPKSNEKLLNDFLFILLQDPPLRQYIINSSERTVGQDGVRKDLLEKYEIYLPGLLEQVEIVRRVGQLSRLADQIEARYDRAKQHFDRLSQSILAKAFRGELVPQDPNDEPAEELLKRVQSQRANSECKPRAPKQKSKAPRASG